jgi:hypothetical protein
MRLPKEILHEYVFNLDGMSESIKARIMRDLEPNEHTGPYSWDISHFCKDGSGNRHAETLVEAKKLLLAYTKSLTAEKIFAKNICY